jgi:hypothetical protein
LFLAHKKIIGKKKKKIKYQRFLRRLIEMRIYFLVFLAAVFVAGAAGLALGGLPLPGTLRMASKTSIEYTASLVRGLYPPRSIRLITVSRGRFSFSAISEIVIPFISHIIGIISHFLINVRYNGYLLNISIAKIGKKVKKCSLKKIFILTYMFVITDNINME